MSVARADRNGKNKSSVERDQDGSAEIFHQTFVRLCLSSNLSNLYLKLLVFVVRPPFLGKIGMGDRVSLAVFPCRLYFCLTVLKRGLIIMLEQNSNQAKTKKQKSMLDLLLEQLNLNYVEFSDYLGISRKTLFQYRSGQREFRLNWQQIRKLEILLEKVNKRLKDLPDDWFRDIEDDN